MLHLAKMVCNNEDALKEGEDLRGQSDTIKKQHERFACLLEKLQAELDCLKENLQKKSNEDKSIDKSFRKNI